MMSVLHKCTPSFSLCLVLILLEVVGPSLVLLEYQFRSLGENNCCAGFNHFCRGGQVKAIRLVLYSSSSLHDIFYT